VRRVIKVVFSLSALFVSSFSAPSVVIADGATRYVAYGASLDSGLGTSCSDPGYRSENQAAIVSALEDASEGDTVRICAGEYTFTDTGYSGALPDGVSIIGAGAGATVLNGDDTYWLLNITGGTGLTIRGITFANGSASYGAALTLQDTEATIIGSEFINNTSITSGEDYGGAGIYVYDASDVTVISSRFEGNVSDEESVGAAINVYTNGVAAALRVERSTFVGNEAGAGPAVYVADWDELDGDASEIVLMNNNFIENVNTNPADESADGGAVAFEHTNGNLTMIGNLFRSNTGAYSGGAVEIWNVTGTIVVERNTFLRNSGGEGGALWIDVRNGTHRIRRNVFQRNVATDSGGAIAFECETTAPRNVARSLQRSNSFSANRAGNRRTGDVFASEYGCVN